MTRRGTVAMLLRWDAPMIGLAILVFALAAAVTPNFLTVFNISQAIADMAEKALLVLPMVLLIVAREIDLSVASQLALTSVVFGMALAAGVPLAGAIPLVLIAGAVLGAFNGLLVTGLGLPSLVVTLGTLALYRGLGYVLLGTNSINVLPDAVTNFGIDTVGNGVVPWTVVPFLVLAPLFTVGLQGMAVGRRIYAIGGNPAAALYSGIASKRVIFLLFVLSGTVCAIAGMVFTARLANARANNAVGFELDVITVAFLGGVSVWGGRGRMTGVLAALVLLATVRNALGLWQVGGDAQGTVVGMLLIAALLGANAGDWFIRGRAPFASLANPGPGASAGLAGFADDDAGPPSPITITEETTP